MKFNGLLVVGFASLLFVAMASTVWAVKPVATTTSITFSPGGTVTVSTSVSAIGAAVVTSDLTPVTAGNMELQVVADAYGNPASCSSQTQFLSGTPIIDVDSSGSATFSLDTSVIGVWRYRMHYNGASSGFGNSFSPCADLIVTGPVCSGVSISADLASGDGTPIAGGTYTWTCPHSS